ncbi:synaptotagmin-like protein 4 [Genypterus blacodes]|uniref:synaptotagmin-like protein 4 n=1 Tax=Genypterus blacodes TaxID=154954 RepID=UPI003F766345
MPEATDMINLAFLSDAERVLILEVLQRDEELRQTEEHRIKKLKTELQDIRRKGAKRGSGEYSERSCGRCQEPISRMNMLSSQCKVCKHHVCRSCQRVHPDGSWLCSVCDKEVDIKKMTGDWFYNQKVNRYTTEPGYDLVRSSIRTRPASKSNETMGELLLNSEINPELPVPVPRSRQLNNPADKSDASGSIGSKGSAAETLSLNSVKTDTGSGHVTPDLSRRSAGSNASSLTLPVTTVILVPEENPASPSPDLEVDRLFKKSIKRAPAAYGSTQDLRDASESSMGYRSQSVPGLDIQDDEEDEDIDSLVSLHKKKMASSSSNLRTSKSTLGSMMSIYSDTGDYDSVEVSGDLVFSLSYDEPAQSLHVFIKECHGLAHGDASRQQSNPYVKCYLLPDKSRQSKKKTTIKRNTVDPAYNETLKYAINRSQLSTRSLLLSVWHHGRFSRNAFLGEVEIPLDSRDLDSAQEECVTLMGKPVSPAQASAFAQYKGELVVTLKYVTPKTPTSPGKNKGKKAAAEEGGELHVLIKEAKNLMAMKIGGTSDSFVKGYLFPTKGKSTKKKTQVVKKNLNPHFDHTFVYKGVSLEQLKEMCLELTVWDKEALTSNEFLGGVRLSTGEGTIKVGKDDMEMDSVGEEVSVWEKMMQYPDSSAEGSLLLRSNMGKTTDN